jgi:hypothetical protein
MTVADAGKLGGKARAENLSPAALSVIGRKGGLVGGTARAQVLSARKRSAIAKAAAQARWSNTPSTQTASRDLLTF